MRRCACGESMEWRGPTPTAKRQVWGSLLCPHCDRPCHGIEGPGRCERCDRMAVKR